MITSAADRAPQIDTHNPEAVRGQFEMMALELEMAGLLLQESNPSQYEAVETMTGSEGIDAVSVVGDLFSDGTMLPPNLNPNAKFNAVV